MERNNTMPIGGENRSQRLRRTLTGIKTGLSFRSSSRASSRTGSDIRNDFSKIAPYRDEVGTELKSIDRSKDGMKIQHEISPTNQDAPGGFKTYYNPNIPPSTPRTPKDFGSLSPAVGSLRPRPSVRLPRSPRDVTSPTSSPISPNRPPLVIRTDTETLSRENSLHPPRSSSLRKTSRNNLKSPSQWTPAGQLRHKASWRSDAPSSVVATPTDSVFGSTMYRKASVKYKTAGSGNRSHGRNTNTSDDSASSTYSVVSTPLTSPGFSAYDSIPTTPFSAVSAPEPPNETVLGFKAIPYNGRSSARVLHDKFPPAITHREVNEIFCALSSPNPQPPAPGANMNQLPVNPIAIQAACTAIPSVEFDASQYTLGGIQYPFLRAFKKICSNDMNFEIDLYNKLVAVAPKGGCLLAFVLIPDGKQAKAEVDSGKGQFEKRVNSPNEVKWDGWASHLWMWCLEEERTAVMRATNGWLNETAHEGIEVNIATYAEDPKPQELLIPTKDLFADEEEPIAMTPDGLGLGLQMGVRNGQVVWDEDETVVEPSVWDDEGFVWDDARYRDY